jgi:cytoskeletal protein CcmA (bactofilin family)
MIGNPFSAKGMDREDVNGCKSARMKMMKKLAFIKIEEKAGLHDFIGGGTEFEGKLKCEGDIRIDGQFKGELQVDGTLTVGADAIVEADIYAPHIAIAGNIHGNIFAGEKLEILAPAKVLGTIEAPKVLIYDGAIFEGSCRMSQAKDFEERRLALVTSGRSLNDALPGPADEEKLNRQGVGEVT